MTTNTEANSSYHNLEKQSTKELLRIINHEDKTVAPVVEKALAQIETFVNAALQKLQHGGRLFYIGAGTSGRLGILDAAECLPTFGVRDRIIGVIAGGERALHTAIEHAEDNPEQGWNDLQEYNITHNDIVLGISASGTTPYVLGAVTKCKEQHILTGGLTANHASALAQTVNYPIAVIVGPEVITGSTRMKAGTAQKLILNMISTTLMIKLGRVRDNKMIHLQPINAKLLDRGTRMIMETLNVDYATAQSLLKQEESVHAVLEKNKIKK